MRIAAAALLLSGCTLLTDLDRYECQTDLDCSAGRVCSANNLCLRTSAAPECSSERPCSDGELCVVGKCEEEEAARFGCVAGRSESPIESSRKVTLQARLRTRAVGRPPPVPNSIKAVACGTPSCADIQGPFIPDQMGIVKVVVNQGFEGFIKLTGEGFIDTFYQLQGPLNGDLANPAEVTMLSVSDVNEIARAASTEVNLQQSGVVVLELRDCLGDLSADVSVSSAESAEANLVYLEADLRKISAAKVTTSAGLVMAFDAPSGRNGFSLTRKTSSNSKVDLGKLDVSAIAGAITYAPHQLGR